MVHDSRPITSEAELRRLIPESNAKVRLKILDRLERHSQQMVALSSLVALSCDADGLDAPLCLLTSRGAVAPRGDRLLRIEDPEGSLRDAWKLGDGQRGVGGLFMVGGIEETLRLNGKAAPCSDGGAVLLTVDEVFLQCPKAFVRSRLWDPETWSSGGPPSLAEVGSEPTATLSRAMIAFAERSPFGLIATEDRHGHRDVSPRGDPVGSFVRCLDDGTLLLPDRTGNHLVDTLRNILTRDRATLLLMIPGVAEVLQIQGRARITANEALLAPSAVKGKAPRVGVLLEVESARAFAGALDGFWAPGSLVDPKDFPTMGEMILDQVNPNGGMLNKIGAKIFDLGSSYHKRRRLY